MLNAQAGSITRSAWGTLEGRPVSLYRLVHGGVTADISDLGGLIVRLLVPDRAGQVEDVVLGFDTVEEYLRPGHSPYFGCVVGRFGNRIAAGRFTLDGRTYQLATNNTPGGIPCHLHGGEVGFDKRLWEADAVVEAGVPVLRLRLHSADGDQGYPGNLDVVVTYRLGADGALEVAYEARTDAPTPVNLTQHAYFNLAGHGTGDILGHHLQVAASRYVPVDGGLIPTGHLAPVAGTPLDFRQPRAIGPTIDADHPQLRAGAGYDHTWVLDRTSEGLAPCAIVTDPVSGRRLEVTTTEPGVQFYAGNFLPGEGAPALAGKAGRSYRRRGGLCLETQHFPDSPNQPSFPSTILQPGQVLRSRTVFRFGLA